MNTWTQQPDSEWTSEKWYRSRFELESSDYASDVLRRLNYRIPITFSLGSLCSELIVPYSNSAVTLSFCPPVYLLALYYDTGICYNLERFR